MQHISIHAIHHHKRRPMQRVGVSLADGLLCGGKGGSFGLPSRQIFEKFYHQQLCGFVGDFPKAHYDGLCASFLEATLQTKYAFACNLTQSSLTRREHHQVKTTEIKAGNLFGGQDAVIRPLGDFLVAPWVEG